MRRFASSFLVLGLAACTPRQGQAPQAETPTAGNGAEVPTESTTPTAAAEAGNGPGPNPLVDDRAADEAHALPRLSVKHLGLHVGGGSGSEDERTALLKALERGQLPVLDCYRLVERPGTSGTFGADLFVAAAGGRPEVRAVRHKLGGPEFEACMASALGKVNFGPQVRPLVVSYSLRFELSS